MRRRSTCYTVTIQLTPEELAALGADAGEHPAAERPAHPGPGHPGDRRQTVDLTARVTTDTNRLAGLTAVARRRRPGTITAEITFSDWNADLTITAPPADQVQGS